MSINYNDALSPYDHKGQVGMKELLDDPSDLEEKLDAAANILSRSNCCLVIVGAGISTSAGIADFRGPNGVWTREKEGKDSQSIDFASAHPTLTHFALVALEKAGIVKWMVSQNVDGLALRSGFAADRLAELHGNVFCEECHRCSRMYYRSFAIPSVGGKLTGRNCEGNRGRSCRGQLRDVTLDWDGALPQSSFSTSCKFAAEADVVLCLGTSLQIIPVGDLPLSVKRNGGKIITVNLQKTKHEKKADIALHAKVDDVMRGILSRLHLSIEPYQEVPLENPILHSTNPFYQFEKRKRVKKEEVKREEEMIEEQPEKRPKIEETGINNDYSDIHEQKCSKEENTNPPSPDTKQELCTQVDQINGNM